MLSNYEVMIICLLHDFFLNGKKTLLERTSHKTGAREICRKLRNYYKKMLEFERVHCISLNLSGSSG